ncbi:MAG: 2-succinyl-5-enolpyruvyl-6-hydroxy-3-cyclohexene-1-carboxylate synthase [Treponema sp.]|nr:2-succinyl-5-enolpyruvyl-6-hydroxy-3-cyclohexene-1-carboxylate synthase [Treponema sp.]
MNHYYTNEKNHQILISLLKQHGIKKIVASPGIANCVFIGSIQNDPFFHIYSCVDERSAAYIACGLALESGEPVVISCTGATASRNYMSGATEAFYSKLPILIVTSSQPTCRTGHLFAQVTDRTCPPKDTCKVSLELPLIDCEEDFWICEVNTNKAILELTRKGGGPAHLNLITPYKFSEEVALTHKECPNARLIKRSIVGDKLPQLIAEKVAVFVGSHKKWDAKTIELIEKFCESHNAVVLCDQTSNYFGKYRIFYPLVINQNFYNKNNTPSYSVDILIHLGEVTGEENAPRMIKSRETWRVSEDGDIRDYFRNMTCIFEMSEKDFFSYYQNGNDEKNTYFDECIDTYKQFEKKLPALIERLPFSNVWIAQAIACLLPSNSTVVLSILNTLRSWNYAEFQKPMNVFSPVGGFGIDGATSMLIGCSLASPNKNCYLITGDLAFFYDLNALGNRHVGKNIRILLVNNGIGVEFKKSYSLAYRLLEDEVSPYVAAEGHFGNKSPLLVKHYAQDLGFEYICASNKEEFEIVYKKFASSEFSDKPILFECFVDSDDESLALDIIHGRKE